MYWYQDPNNGLRTHAGLALHAGRLLEQYYAFCSKLEEIERYDATLTLCVLQTMLTNHKELLDQIEKDLPKWFSDEITDIPSKWGLRKSFFDYTFPYKLNYAKVLSHLRDAVSHPSASHNLNSVSTGYSVFNDCHGRVGSFRFVHAPFMGSNKSVKVYSKKEDADKSILRYTKDDVISTQRDDGKWQPTRDGKVFNPRMVAIVPLEALKIFTIEFATVLAHPAMNEWNGKQRFELGQVSPLALRQVR